MSENQNINREERKKITVDISQKETFNGLSRIDYKSSTNLANSINSVFQTIFKDYNGCFIDLGNMAIGESPVVVVMDFIPTYDNGFGSKISAFQEIGSSAGPEKAAGPIVSNITKHNYINKSKETFEITWEAVDVLHKYILPNLKARLKETPKSYQKQKVFTESVEAVNTGMFSAPKQVIHEYIRCLDIEAILKELLPETNDLGNKVIYTIAPVNWIPSGFGYQNGQVQTNSLEYLFAISQLDESAMKNLVAEFRRADPTVQNRVVTVR